jgi:DNA-directed RNA polymerase subunit RPC12/RpoP
MGGARAQHLTMAETSTGTRRIQCPTCGSQEDPLKMFVLELRSPGGAATSQVVKRSFICSKCESPIE